MNCWYPEIRAGVVFSIMVTLIFPPFVVDSQPGQTSFVGWHSLFTQETGYVSLSRLVLFWLLVLCVGAISQLSAERCSSRTTESTFFGLAVSPGRPLPVPSTSLLVAVLALPTWFFLCGLALGRSRVLGMTSELAYFGCVAFQLVILSRILIWLFRDRSTLQLAYLILGVASLAWDLRTSPTPQNRIGGLVPIYILIGYLLYRFDLRFVAPVPAPAPPSLGEEPSPAALTESPEEIEPLSADPEPTAVACADEQPQPPSELPPGPSEPTVSEDPYQRYRPKL